MDFLFFSNCDGFKDSIELVEDTNSYGRYFLKNNCQIRSGFFIANLIASYRGACPLQSAALVAMAVNDITNKTAIKIAIVFNNLFDFCVSNYITPFLTVLMECIL